MCICLHTYLSWHVNWFFKQSANVLPFCGWWYMNFLNSLVKMTKFHWFYCHSSNDYKVGDRSFVILWWNFSSWLDGCVLVRFVSGDGLLWKHFYKLFKEVTGNDQYCGAQQDKITVHNHWTKGTVQVEQTVNISSLNN